MIKKRIYRIEPRIAVGPVDQSMKPGVERHRSFEAIKLKLWSAGFAVHGQIAKCALIVPVGTQNACDTFEVVKVGVLKTVVSRERCIAGIGNIPWPDDFPAYEQCQWAAD